MEIWLFFRTIKWIICWSKSIITSSEVSATKKQLLMLFYNNLSLKYASYKRESGVNSSLIIFILLLTCESLLKFTSCGMNYHPYSYSFLCYTCVGSKDMYNQGNKKQWALGKIGIGFESTAFVSQVYISHYQRRTLEMLKCLVHTIIASLQTLTERGFC